MPMYPYGNSENAPAADMGEAGGSNEAIPPAAPAAVPISEQAKGFPLPGVGLPGGVFDSDYPAGPAWRDPSYPAPSIEAPPKAPPSTG
jgi:hypothetical protein